MAASNAGYTSTNTSSYSSRYSSTYGSASGYVGNNYGSVYGNSNTTYSTYGTSYSRTLMAPPHMLLNKTLTEILQTSLVNNMKLRTR